MIKTDLIGRKGRCDSGEVTIRALHETLNQYDLIVETGNCKLKVIDIGSITLLPVKKVDRETNPEYCHL